jgi:hypothetical protein
MALILRSGKVDEYGNEETAYLSTRLRRSNELRKASHSVIATAPDCSFLIGRNGSNGMRSRQASFTGSMQHILSTSSPPSVHKDDAALIGAAAQRSWDDEESLVSPAQMGNSLDGSMRSTSLTFSQGLVNCKGAGTPGRSLLKTRDPLKDITPRSKGKRRDHMEQVSSREKPWGAQKNRPKLLQ